jgi:hypothetical protein
MLKRSFAAFTLLVLFSALADAQVKQPKTVRDFFMALPEDHFSLDCCIYKRSYRQAKIEYLKRYLMVEDTANGFLSGGGEAAQEGFEMALFKRADGSYLIGFFTFGEGGLEDTPWTVFLDYKNGKWTDVSKSVVPDYSKEKYEYHLPRRGTTIQVYRKVEEGDPPKMYDLIWDRARFVKKE